MKKLILILIIFLALLSGCSDSRPSELYETAKFEELQNNKEHAVQLYEEIVEKYPGSEYSKKAKDRLSQIKMGPKRDIK